MHLGLAELCQGRASHGRWALGRMERPRDGREVEVLHAMIVTEPNEFAAEIHDRMPVFLMKDQFAPWLSGKVDSEYLKAVPNDHLQRWPVSKRVNSSKADADDPTLIEQVVLKAA